MCSGFAADPGSTAGLGVFAACHSPSLSPCFLSPSSALHIYLGEDLAKSILASARAKLSSVSSGKIINPGVSTFKIC